MGLGSFAENISNNWKTILVTSLIMLFVVVTGAVIVFFLALQPEDQVMVPNIVGKDLNSSLLELQAKELNARVQFRYTDTPGDEGTVLEQNPGPGAIIKAGRKVDIIVSNGTIMTQVGNYVGRNILEVEQELGVLFTSGSKYLVLINDSYNYRFDNAPSGTVLAQDPPAGTDISDRVVLSFVVSKGPKGEMVAMPNLTGAGLNSLYSFMANTKLIFDFSASESESIENPIVASQARAEGESLEAYSKVLVNIDMPKQDSLMYGVYAVDLPAYPYPVDVSVDVINPNGERTQLVNVKHPGGSFTFPYGLPKSSILVLSVLGRQIQSTIIE